MGCDVLCVAPAGESEIVLGCSDGCVRRLNWSSRKVVRTWRVDEEGVYAVALSPDGRTVAAGGHLHLTALDGASGRVLTRRSHRSDVGLAQFVFGGRCLITKDADVPTRLWDAASWQYSGTLAALDVLGDGVSASSDGLRLAQQKPRRVRILDLRP